MRRRKVSLADFELCRVLGRGSMGKVFLARDTSTRNYYALKTIAKHRLLEHQELQHARSERDILATLARIRHPYLIRLLYSFQDEDQLYLVLDYHRGGDIASELARMQRFDEKRVLFYACEIVAGIAELHRRGIIYRDLKPENILLAQDGHLVLTDFGLSKQFAGDFGPTDTFCGTAEYLAPEVLRGERYSYSVDWWSLGTLLYEMIFGITPFWDDNHAVMYRRVLHDTLVFPGPISEEARSLLVGLLERDPKRRLGHGPADARQVQAHPFFASVDWDAVAHKKLVPPCRPASGDAEDLSHFEEEFSRMTPRLSPVDPFMRDFVSRRALSTSAQVCFEGFSFD
ncbi:molecular mechanism For the regulation of protein kinase B Akt By hydrophobic motif phosphorylation, partial [Thamnocephalis sphaerospora]